MTDITQAIANERAFQKVKYGDAGHDLMLWIRIMAKELAEAEHALIKQTKEDALREVLQVIAVGVAALEQHGCVEREEVKGQFRVSRETVHGCEYFTRYASENKLWACWDLDRQHGVTLNYALASEIYRVEKSTTPHPAALRLERASA